MIYLVTLIGLVFRLVLANQSFWLDEGASIMAARVPLAQFFEYLKSDFHPPLYYLYLNLWLPVAGNAEWLIRLPDILLGTASVLIIYFIGKTIFDKGSKLPILMALFLALNPFHIYYSQELRMYNFSSFFVLLSWLALLRNKYIFVSLANFLSLFSFYGAGFNFLSQGLYLLFTKRKELGKFALSFIPSVIGFIFWWPVFSVQLINGSFLQDALPGWSLLSGSATIKSLLLIPIKFIIGRVNLEPQSLYFLIGGFLILLFSALSLFSLKDKKSYALWFYFLVPLVLATIISLKTPILGYWRYLFVLPAFLSLVAVGVTKLSRRLFIAAVIFICSLFVSANLYFWLTPPFQREDWRGLARALNGQNALVVLPFSGVFAPLTFYQTDVEYLPLQTQLGQEATNGAVLVKNELANHSVVYVLDYLADLTDPQRSGLKAVRSLNLREAGVYNFNNVGQVYEFRQP
jgi:uncharacterized membrane protein